MFVTGQRLFIVAGAALALLGAGCQSLGGEGATSSEAAAAAAAPPAAAAGFYTEPQAARGKSLFADSCAICHGADMGGGPAAPALRGPEFQFGWNGRSVGELLEYIHKSMPPGQGGSLSGQQYADIAAAILSSNDLPPGTMELPVDLDQNRPNRLELVK